MRRQRQQKRRNGSAQHEQRSGEEHEDFVLRHVGRKERRAQAVERRNQRNNQRQPAPGESERFTAAQTSARHPPRAAQVKPCRKRKAGQRERFQTPGRPQVMRLRRTAFVWEGGRGLRRDDDKCGDDGAS
jgi:hypothetical protein